MANNVVKVVASFRVTIALLVDMVLESVLTNQPVVIDNVNPLNTGIRSD